jgi:hypothetical protein
MPPVPVNCAKVRRRQRPTAICNTNFGVGKGNVPLVVRRLCGTCVTRLEATLTSLLIRDTNCDDIHRMKQQNANRRRRRCCCDAVVVIAKRCYLGVVTGSYLKTW